MPSDTDTDEPKTYRCRSATDSGERCSYRGTRDELRAHTADVGHDPCWSCKQGLAGHEQQTCGRCADRVRDDLTAVAGAYALLELRIAEGAYSGGWLTALAMVSDGSVAGLKPWREFVGGDPVEVQHPQVGRHAAYLERRTPPDGREHFEDHWPSDPLSVLAFLEANERDWRRRFGHGPADDVATVPACLQYLRTWHATAARQHPYFEDYAGEVWQLRTRLEHVVALATDPLVAPIPCACGGRLERHFAPQGGLADDWTCRSCRASYDESAYLLRLRVLTEVPGWVSVDAAARATDRPVQSVWAWVRAGDVPVACSWFTRRMVVELGAVQVRSDAAPRVVRRSA
jgi:hypothetical protein